MFDTDSDAPPRWVGRVDKYVRRRERIDNWVNLAGAVVLLVALAAVWMLL